MSGSRVSGGCQDSQSAEELLCSERVSFHSAAKAASAFLEEILTS